PNVCTNYGGTCDGGNFLVTFPGVGAFAGSENTTAILRWIDNAETNPQLTARTDGNWCNHRTTGDCELRPEGATPLAGLLNNVATNIAPVVSADPIRSCRPYSVILLTDGAESCSGNPEAAATALAAMGIDVYVVGLAVGGGAETQLNAIATAGGTDAGSPGGDTAYFANDPNTLSAGLADIVQRSLRFETCDNTDEDCDGLVDEGFAKYCNRAAGITTTTLCAEPADPCNGVDDDCDGTVDEGSLNACGTCGAVPTEVCDGLDNNCNGVIDEGGVCDTCIVNPEICDNLDNDCDGRVDETLSRGCGTDVGECSAGTQTCAAGMWGACSGTGPTTETCNNRDDDCDGVIDGITRPCGNGTGECRQGTQTCTAGSFGACSGEVTGGMERCDTLDNDCDGRTDEDTGGGTCGSMIGACTTGTLSCVMGTLTCTGGTLPSAETCDGEDDDCDGRVDEGVPTMGACGNGTGECRQGVRTCVSGTYTCVGGRGPTTELCNGLDDNCNGSTDEGNPGGGVTCGSDTGFCETGLTQCSGGMLVCSGGVGPRTEACNNVDDDCDGTTDEGNPDGGMTCGMTDVGICDFGRRVCEGGMLVCRGATDPRTERCDGLDNDCDGMTDEGNPEGGAACGDDTGECTAGSTRCTGGMLVCEGGMGPVEEMCNGLDDDCDGVVDDGLGVGAPCGSDVGECVPGFQVCRDGMVVCEGAIDGIDEVCDALDNDCDGTIDESLPLGGECGRMEGLCEPGALQCISGREVCVGEVPANREACDCEDNDCDGTIDENPEMGTLCPDGSACVGCGCSLPCVMSEFGNTCPSSRTPFVDDTGACWCVTPRCDAAACAGETVSRDDEVLCGTEDGAPTCICKNNECTFPCDGVSCGDGLVCDPDSGRCVEDSCRALGCPDGEVCNFSTGACEIDACADVTCGAAEACRAGTCEPTCATADCDDDEICRAGVCSPNLCVDVRCGGGQVCDPADGSCITDECASVRCPPGLLCDPTNGMCEQDPCDLLRCPEGTECVAGECYEEGTVEPDAGTPDAGVDAGVDAGTGTGRSGDRVLAAGGGGCACAVPGATPSKGGEGPLALGALFLGFVAWRRRRRGGSAPKAKLARAAVIASTGAALMLGSGCDVEPYCLVCVDAATVDAGPVDGGQDAGRDAQRPDTGAEDAGGDALPDGCLTVELCNELDDDCDGNVDEGIDTTSDVANCGGCGMDCAPAHAFGQCMASTCSIATCDVGWLDLNGDLEDGCEYRCLPTAEDDSLCDLRDNDCDGTVDEDVAFTTDPSNCGSCGRSCRFRHVDNPRCEASVCTYEAGDCEEGWYDINGVATDGCEYSCTPADPAVETCNARDDDCDGTIDEGDPGGGGSCGVDTGACSVGTNRCVEGSVICMGAVTPTTELCNATDDDCDGNTDENNPEGGRACGESVGSCELGRQVCTAGALVCTGATDPVAEACDGLDNDCDGRIDEGNPGGGGACGETAGACDAGTFQCRGGTLVCEGATGPATETCNGTDDDCDGMTDEGNPGGGGTCGTDVGACNPGTLQCQTGMLRCIGATTGSVETCNGIDDDCDGTIDDGNPGGGGACGSTTGACTAGTLQCLGGALSCQGGTGPSTEVCDTVDNDCDGTNNEGFDLMNDLRNCGTCGRVCTFANGVPSCMAGTCRLAGCNPGFRNADGNEANGCEYACDFAGAEICNGRDDDCDGRTDESLTRPSNFCNPNGVCSGTNATCSGVGGWVCNYPATYEETEESCDGRDNDCDGTTDEPFPSLGTSCSNGTGACRRTGMTVCNATQDGVRCNAAAAGTPGTESCNNVDDDCDSRVDENPGSLVPFVTVPRASGGGSVDIMRYEASRPDATASSSGQAGGYACSRAGVMPWTNVNWATARASCQALGTGWDLCEESDWERACFGPNYANPATRCDWSYSSACTTSSSVRCNGEEYDSGGAAGDQDALFPTGSTTFSGCYTAWTGGGQVWDMSGNVKEWTRTSRGSGARAIRGGSYNNVEGGRACDFDFTVANESFSFVNTGFRCCRY
ncbi:MAG: SUMF1/EgtB/PvdO family nonheme iron enzyme, partial [Sandaracinus sp.]|nr:SUMF1/EgtB/PvdO family nonheme iron enzyme [Sandaracinus sp.]